MDYKLAKELKDAGFPQDKDNLSCICAFPEERALDKDGKPTEIYSHNGPYVYEPTLSELISALGEDFDALYSNHSSLTDQQGADKWRADATNRTGHSVTGSSPEEVLAKLWLTLR